MMSMLLGFPYIVEEPAAHLFGIPHGHEHFASNFELLSML